MFLHCCPKKIVVRLYFRNLAIFTLFLPLFGFFFIILWSIFMEWETTTSTHCHVTNYLPSLSAAMGDPGSLQDRVWKVCIALHALPRFFIIWMYSHYLRSTIQQEKLPLIVLAGGLNSFENLGLLGLTFIGSLDNYDIHRNCFFLFVSCAEIYSIILTALLRSHRSLPPTVMENKSLWAKHILIVGNIFSLVCAMYTFARHNSRCEPGVYSLFALFEYIVVLTNMAFHMTAYWDFYHTVIILDNCKLRLDKLDYVPLQTSDC